jgi:hypothetical protein
MVLPMALRLEQWPVDRDRGHAHPLWSAAAVALISFSNRMDSRGSTGASSVLDTNLSRPSKTRACSVPAKKTPNVPVSRIPFEVRLAVSGTPVTPGRETPESSLPARTGNQTVSIVHVSPDARRDCVRTGGRKTDQIVRAARGAPPQEGNSPRPDDRFYPIDRTVPQIQSDFEPQKGMEYGCPSAGASLRSCAARYKAHRYLLTKRKRRFTLSP